MTDSGRITGVDGGRILVSVISGVHRERDALAVTDLKQRIFGF